MRPKPLIIEPREQPDGTYKAFQIDVDPEVEIPIEFGPEDLKPIVANREPQILKKPWDQREAIRIVLTEKRLWNGLSPFETEILDAVIKFKHFVWLRNYFNGQDAIGEYVDAHTMVYDLI